MNKTIRSGYIHVEPVLGNYIHGDGKLGDAPVNPGGQWDAFLPETHEQDINGFEPNDCVTEATINCIETLEIQEYGTNSGWARRFLAKNSGTDIRGGNDPQTVSEALRTGGTTYESDYPFSAKDFNTFYQALSQSLKTLALAAFSKFSYGHSWVNADPDSMMAALEYSPLSAAGFAWTTDPNTGYYISPSGSVACHDFEVYGYDPHNYWKVRDSYPDESGSFDKKLAWNYQFTGVKRHTLHRQAGNTPTQQSAWSKFLQLIYQILGFQGPSFGAARSKKWPEVQKAFLKQNPICAVCSKKGTVLNPLNVHHKQPFHVKPALELDPNNLITLCRVHHFLFGHLLNWSSWNIEVEQDAYNWREKIKDRP